MPLVSGSDRRHLVAKEFGSGAYGTVLPTETSNVVMKITTDRSEAAFAASLLRMREMPEGVVRYFAAYALPVRHNDDRVYVLWREEAFHVGKVLSWQDTQLLDRYLDAAHNVYSEQNVRTSWREAVAAAEDMERYGGPFQAIGSTLRWFLSVGILVSDIHGGNIGLVQRFGSYVAVITDPGRVVFFRKAVKAKPVMLR